MIQSKIRNKLKFNVIPSDQQLFAIGLIVVQWGIVEEFQKTFVHSLLSHDEHDNIIRNKHDTTRSLEIRLDILSDLTRERVDENWRPAMLELINDTRQLAELRHKIVHGLWGGKSNSTEPEIEAHGPGSWGRPGPIFSWKLSYRDIMNVAIKIDNHIAAMNQIAFRAAGSPLPHDFTLSSALGRISKKTTSHSRE